MLTTPVHRASRLLAGASAGPPLAHPPRRIPRRGNRRGPLVPWLLCLLLLGCTATEKGPSPRAGKHKGEEAKPVELTAVAEPVEAKVGEPVTFRITLEADPKIPVSIPDVGARIEGFRIVDFGREGPRRREGRNRSQRWYKLVGDFAGSYVLPAVKVSYRDPAGKEQTVETEKIFVKVASAPAPEGGEREIRDIKPLVEIHREIPRSWFLWGGGGLALLAAAVGLFFLHRRRRRNREIHLGPEELARRELEDLEATGLLDEQRYREYVFGLSLIFRRYLERRFRLPAAERTTEEILADLRRARHLEKELKGRARTFLEETDPIKYRGLEPSGEETEAWRARLLAFLEDAAAPEETEATREAA